MSHGSEQSEDYWPGYVDALTSMVQVLAFVMMLLAVTVYVLSKNISKGAVEKIAKAANVSPAPNSTVKELTEKIVEELSKQSQQGAGKAEAAPKTETAAKSEAKTDGKSKSEEAGEAKGETKGEAAATIARSAELQAEGKDQPTITTTQKRTATSATQSDAQTEPPPDARNITLKFPERTYRLDPAGQGTLNTFIDETGAAGPVRFIIRAYAANANGSVTEGRHMAYYRAMVARQALSARKVPSKSIAIRILDTSNVEQGGSIEIFAVPEGAQ